MEGKKQQRITGFVIDESDYVAWGTMCGALRERFGKRLSEGDLLRGLVIAATEAFTRCGGATNPRAAAKAIYPFDIVGAATPESLPLAAEAPAHYAGGEKLSTPPPAPTTLPGAKGLSHLLEYPLAGKAIAPKKNSRPGKGRVAPSAPKSGAPGSV